MLHDYSPSQRHWSEHDRSCFKAPLANANMNYMPKYAHLILTCRIVAEFVLSPIEARPVESSLFAPDFGHNVLTQFDLGPLLLWWSRLYQSQLPRPARPADSSSTDLLCEFVAMHSTREPALRSDTELLKRGKLCRLTNPGNHLVLVLEFARLGRDQAERDSFVPFRQVTQRLETA